ncbi:MAG: hypothetical protein U0930_03705 [Pirellulales bacterium]
MTFEEAIELSKAIYGNSAFEVMAIGRFKPFDQILESSPWGVSIFDRVTEVHTVIWTEDDWRRAAAPTRKASPVAEGKPTSKPDSKPSASAVGSSSKPSEQLSLF